jgi:hypothetical protein
MLYVGHKMGQTSSCYKTSQAEQSGSVAPSSALYTLYFVCSTDHYLNEAAPIQKILYSENWCSSEWLWNTYILNALREIEQEQLSLVENSKKIKISRLRVITRVHGDIVMGTVKWISRDVDIKILDDKIKVNSEKGLYFVEPFWTTYIVPHLVIKDNSINIDKR